MKQTQRIFQVYIERRAGVMDITSLSSKAVETTTTKAQWRWRLIGARNRQIVGGSQEAFDSRGNALRAARREAGFYQPGTAAVEVAL